MLSIILAAFTFVSPAEYRGPKPVEFTDDSRADWFKFAPSAEVAVADEPPQQHIILQWRKLGVKIYKRIRFDPDFSPEFVRRQAGFYALREDVDGIWLEDEKKATSEWKQAIAEAKKDVEIALYAAELAGKALTMKATNHKVWIEGRRVMWFFRFMDFEGENIDTLRLEYICYAKRLEQLLEVKPKNLPIEIAKPALPITTTITPPENLHPERFQASLEKTKLELSEGLTFTAGTDGFNFKFHSNEPFEGSHPGGKAIFRLWISDGSGGYLPYAFKIDLTPVDLKRAPFEGGTFQEDRWNHGVNQLYTHPTDWRLKALPRRSYGLAYPKLYPGFRFEKAKDGKGWSFSIGASWFSFWGHWPCIRNGVSDRWYVTMESLPGIPASVSRIDWARGREINYRKIAERINCKSISERYAAEKGKSSGIYYLWYKERLYGFAKTKTPTFQRCDTESDKVFWDRVVEPMIYKNKNLEEITKVVKDQDDHDIPAKLTKADKATKEAVYKSLGNLFDFAERVSIARRDYILTRWAGGMPPEPPPREQPEGAASLKAPDVDNDDEAIQLDDKEF